VLHPQQPIDVLDGVPAMAARAPRRRGQPIPRTPHTDGRRCHSETPRHLADRHLLHGPMMTRRGSGNPADEYLPTLRPLGSERSEPPPEDLRQPRPHGGAHRPPSRWPRRRVRVAHRHPEPGPVQHLQGAGHVPEREDILRVEPPQRPASSASEPTVGALRAPPKTRPRPSRRGSGPRSGPAADGAVPDRPAARRCCWSRTRSTGSRRHR